MIKRFQVNYSYAALEDLKAIHSYIVYELRSPIAAKRLERRIRDEIRSLDYFPERYAVVDYDQLASIGLRRVPVGNYIVYYLIDLEKLTVTVARILYGGLSIENIVRELERF